MIFTQCVASGRDPGGGRRFRYSDVLDPLHEVHDGERGAADLEERRQSEKDAELAQKLGQLSLL